MWCKCLASFLPCISCAISKRSVACLTTRRFVNNWSDWVAISCELRTNAKRIRASRMSCLSWKTKRRRKEKNDNNNNNKTREIDYRSSHYTINAFCTLLSEDSMYLYKMCACDFSAYRWHFIWNPCYGNVIFFVRRYMHLGVCEMEPEKKGTRIVYLHG